MKRILVFRLDNNTYFDKKVASDFQLIAYLLYEAICDYEEDEHILDSNKLIRYNQLIDTCDEYGYSYALKSDGMFFEPLAIDEMSFGITIYDGSISLECLKRLLNESLKVVGVNYNINIGSISYIARDADDEHNRPEAVAFLKGRNEDVTSNFSKKKSLKKIGFVPSLLKIFGR